MERGIYFDGWFPGQYCSHPSMPPRRLQMLSDIEAMRGTMLVWAGLGGGSISLPYLEQEAYGPVPEHFRQYGFVNDSEFIAHCNARGIAFFGIVFESQGWEFPAELADGVVLAQNELRGAGERGWVGLREFSSDAGPASWKPWRHYFPDGLTNSAGEQVTDLWEEGACRDLRGNPLHAHWVEVHAREQHAYYMDRNNPVWREYLKAVIRIQIDAGVAGVQLDETDTPMSALRYGGCFCRDCVVQFGEYLRGLAEPPAELAGVDLATFDYREYLLDLGHKPGDAPQSLPLYRHFSRFLQLAITRTYTELADYARAYASSRGRAVRVGGNFYDLAPYYDGMISAADVVITEMRHTRYQQPWWFRHGVGLSRGRPLVAVENPYGGMIPELLSQLRRGRGYDRFRLTLFEANAMGANMSMPYGSWLGTDIEDSYWAPPELVRECGRFLESVDQLTSHSSLNEVAVLCSIRSNMAATIDSDQFSDEGRFFSYEGDPAAHPVSYWPVLEALSRGGVPFDVVIAPDDELRPAEPGSELSADALRRYRVVVAPDCWDVSPVQHRALLGYLDGGGQLVVHGDYGVTLDGADPADRSRLLGHTGVRLVSSPEEAAALVHGQVRSPLGPEHAVNLHALGGRDAALHVVNFGYDEAADEVRPLRDVVFQVRLAGDWSGATVYAPGWPPESVPVHCADGVCTVTVPELRSYAVVHLRRPGAAA